MQPDRASLEDTAKLQLPQDLVAEMSRRPSARNDSYYQVEAFKPSFFGRLALMFGGKRR